MEFFNLLNIEPSAALSIKDRYESALKATNRLDESAALTFDDMFKHLNITDSILVDNTGKIIPFSIQSLTSEFSVTFYAADNCDTLKSFLESINYDLSSLKQVSNDAAMQMELLGSGTPYVIMGSKIYIV